MQAHANMHANSHANLQAPCHVLPTLPEPEPGSHGHAMPPALPGRYDEPLDLGTGQFAVRAQHVVARLFRTTPGLRYGRGLQQHVVHRLLQLALVHPRAHGGVALWV